VCDLTTFEDDHLRAGISTLISSHDSRERYLEI